MNQAGEQSTTPQVPAAELGPSANASTIEHQQVEMIYARAPSSLVAALFIALLLTVCLWGVADHTHLLSWFGAHLLLTVVRLWHVYRFRKAEAAVRSKPRWEKIFLVGALVSGVAWGSIGLIYDFNWEVQYQILVIMCMTGLQTAAVSSYAAINSIYVAFLVPSVIVFT
ncbi:MAG: hypothetical protein KJP03_04280, partial [Gammaproteobacteria bacterium]|nr:hypothetical protein [Gammaproteobacteria bacterium]